MEEAPLGVILHGGLRPGEQPEPELSSTAPLGGSFEDVRRAAI
jgi:hypothetical protein